MPQEVTKVRIFVASPGDVWAERDALADVVAELNYTMGQKLGFVIELVRWETHSRPGAGRPQGVINDLIGPYDVFLGIMWNRFGTPTGEADSGTEEEFDLAYAEWERGERPHILFYFCQAPYTFRTQDELDQRGKVLKFRSSLREKTLVWEYESKETFADTVRPHLSGLLLDMFSGKLAPDGARDVEERLRRVQADLNKLGLAAVSGTIEFPETEEGRERLEQFRRAMATGAPLAVPKEYVKGPLTDVLDTLLGPSARTGAVVTIGSVPADTSLLLKAKMECEDGTSATLDYIHLRNIRRGGDEVALDNSHQALPWKFAMVLSEEGVHWNITYSTKTEPPNARRELDAILFAEAMYRGGTLRMEYAESGLDLPEISVAPGIFPQPDDRWKRLVEKLVLIQEKVQIPLTVPTLRDKESGTIAAEDERAIFETAQKLETGKASLGLPSWETAVDPPLAEKFIDLFEKGEPVSLSFSSEDDVVNVLGVDISLGPTVHTCQQTSMTEEDLRALKERTAHAVPGESIPIRFTPFDNAPMLIHYLNWLPANDRDFLLNQMKRNS
jgi:hypothetical protein